MLPLLHLQQLKHTDTGVRMKHLFAMADQQQELLTSLKSSPKLSEAQQLHQPEPALSLP